MPPCTHTVSPGWILPPAPLSAKLMVHGWLLRPEPLELPSGATCHPERSTGGGGGVPSFTCTRSCACLPLLWAVAVMVAVPSAWLVTSPDDETVAIDLSLLVHESVCAAAVTLSPALVRPYAAS